MNPLLNNLKNQKSLRRLKTLKKKTVIEEEKIEVLPSILMDNEKMKILKL